MQISSIEFRNFASYGNSLQKIEFNENKGDFYLILGQNGAGKSTIANIIIFGLYGQLDGVNLSDLPNRINKNLWVRIKLKCNKKNVVIERGLNPKIFKVEIDGIILDNSSKNNIQEYLENEIFEIPYNVFKNIIILSINDFKSFLMLKTKDKRLIIDKLFGFSIINDMFEKVKVERKILKENILKVQSELNTIENSIKATNDKLIELESITQTENENKINQFKNTLIELNKEYIQLKESKNKLDEKIKEYESQIDILNEKYNKENIILVNAKKKLKLYEKDICPECGKKLDTDFDKKEKKKYEKDFILSSNNLNKINNSIIDIKNKISESKVQQNQFNNQIVSLSVKINSIKNELFKIINIVKNGNSEFNYFKNLINEFNTNKELKNLEFIELSKQDNFIALIEEMLGNDGVKNMIIKIILPGLNAILAEMIQEMDLKFNIKFNDKFDCIITYMGEEINPATLSTGERKKADFVIIISLIKLLKLRFPNLNILFLDEIFSSIDYDGIYSILKILNQIIKEYNLNIFVINHSILPYELFDKKIEVYKESGFSKLKIESIT